MLEKEGGNLVHYRKCNKKLIKYKAKLQYTGPRVSINIKSRKEESTKFPPNNQSKAHVLLTQYRKKPML